jgi:hypothetical protein
MMRAYAAILVLVFTTASWAQTTAGAVVGLVLDPNGGTVSDVSVVAVETDTNRRWNTTTNDSGGYSISNLPPGTYRLEFEQTGFKKVVQTGIEVRVNENARSNAVMEVGPLTETINVTAPPPVLQTDNSSIGGTIDHYKLERLPLNGRQLESLFLLFPGTVTAAPNSHLSNRGGLNMVGMDEHYFSYLLDGSDNVDPVIRGISYRPSIDAVEEIKVEQSGYGAEFGRNGGAVISITTKSGSNLLHGSVWEYLRNDNFDARNFFLPAAVDKPPLIRNQFGASIGGPLSRDRTFIFFLYEGLRQKAGQVRRATVPTERMRFGDLREIGGPVIADSQIHPISREVLQAYPLPNQPGLTGNRIEIANKIENGNDFSLRLDHGLTSNTQLTGRVSTSVARVLDPFRTETTGASNLSAFGQTADRVRINVGLAATTVINQRMTHEFRAGFNRFRQPQIPVNPGTPLQEPLMGFLKTFLNFNFFTADPLGSNAEFKRVVNVYNFMDNLSFTDGSHQIKVGVDLRRYLFNAYNVGPNIFIFTGARTASPAGPGNPMGDFLLGLPTQSISFDGSPSGNTRKLEFAGYIHDDWKVTPRLTVNFGLRWEFYGRIKERVNKQSFWEPECNCMRIAGIDASTGLVDNDFNNFAPRLGFAWRPTGSHTVIRASGGLYYDNDMRHNFEFATNPPFFFVREYVFPPSLSDPFPPAGSSSTLRPNTLDKKFEDTYVEHWNFSLQREISSGFLAEAAYVGNHSVKARRLRNVNQPINGVAPYTGFGPISLFEQAGSSSYNALQLRVERRFSGKFGLTSSYTFGHAIDDRPGQGGGRAPDNYNMRAERGSADFDVRHNWTSSLSLNLPGSSSNLWGGWSLNAIGTVQSGRAFTVVLPGINGERPDVVPGVDWKPVNQGPDLWINPAAFSVPAAGTFGNLGRNTLRGPELHNLDLSLVKAQVFESTRLELRAEFFNVLNHPNWNIPNAVVGPTLGLISSTASPERQVQFGARLAF